MSESKETLSDRLAGLMDLTNEQKEQLVLKHYNGGHMFYTWHESRVAFTKDISAFYTRFYK